MATKKYLDLSGLTQYDTKIKSVIPSKTSDLTNDSGFITDSKVVYITYGENILWSTVNSYIENGYDVICIYNNNAQSIYTGTFYLSLFYEKTSQTKPPLNIFRFGSFISDYEKNIIVTLTADYDNNYNEIYGTWAETEFDLQEELVSGTNIKTINNTSLLGSGNISISGGTATDVQINGTSIVSSDVANIITESAYNSSTNKIATMSDIPTFVTTDETLCSGLSLASNTYNSPTDVSITKSGYKPLGIMGYSMTGTNHQSTNIVILDLTASSNGSGTIQYRFRNLSASATATITLTAKVLWLKI